MSELQCHGGFSALSSFSSNPNDDNALTFYSNMFNYRQQ
jgi:hypothetical protein